MAGKEKINFVHKSKPIILIHINGFTIKTLIDSGAEVNVISKRQFDRLNKHENLEHLIEPSTYSASSVSGEKLEIFGEVKLRIRLGYKNGICIVTMFSILKTSVDKCLLGFPFLCNNEIDLLSDGILFRSMEKQKENIKQYSVISNQNLSLGPKEIILEVKLLDYLGEEGNIGKEVIIISYNRKDNQEPIFYSLIESGNPSKTFTVRTISTESEIVNVKRLDLIGLAFFYSKDKFDDEFYRIMTIILNHVKTKGTINQNIKDLMGQIEKMLQENIKIRSLFNRYKFFSVFDLLEKRNFQINKIMLDNTNTVSNTLEIPRHYTSKSYFTDTVEFINEDSENEAEFNEYKELAPRKLNFESFDNMNTPVETDGIGYSKEEKTLEYINETNCYTEGFKPQLLKIMFKYHKALSSSKFDFGRYNGEPIKVRVKDDSKPIFCKYRPTPPQLKEPAQKLLDKLEEKGIIKRGTSNWSSCARWVIKGAPDLSAKQAKKRGVEAGAKDMETTEIDLRLTIDLRILNSVILYENFPILSIKRMISLIAKAKYVSLIDLPSSFYQIPLSKDSQKYFGFSANNLSYILLAMPMGSKNSQQNLMATLTTILRGLEHVTMVYSDNIGLMTYEDDPHAHLVLIEEVLKRFKNSGLKISVTKSHYMISTKLQLFGHRIDLKNRTIRPDHSKIEKLLNLPFPTTRKLLCSFLGGLNFFSEILGPIAEHLATLNTLLRNPDQNFVT